ncbi:DUF916 and DUF3324 domain-containing protein [Lacticaseibacillus porcinae]|uniref:DUF916 and DUF3324 domain-containing protein n=1 Tax=Lacticaseibacillus porcinae TaxID=1123687 RepID=UPI0013DE413F|nr:DUF916 and DUF3324 domain-containing protein [Lacticaseibacillus porcinae]
MRNFFHGIGLVVAMFGLAMLFHAQPVQATGASFTVAPQLTAQQTGGIKGYFNLKLAPQQTNRLAVTITNLTNKAKTLQVQPVNASTTDGGMLSYDPGTAGDTSAKYRFTDLVANPKPITVKVPANAQQVVSYQVTMPKQALTGQILGALRVEDTAGYDGSNSKGIGLTNHFAMVVAAQLQNDPTQVAPKLHLRQVKPGIQDHQAAVLATIQNSKPRLFNQLSMKMKVTKRGDTKTVISRQGQNMTVAPNSHFTYAVFSEKALVAGDYTLHVTAKAQGWKWQFTRNFTITRVQAATTNRKANLKVEHHIPWLWIIIGILVLVIIFLLILLLRRNRKSEKD